MVCGLLRTKLKNCIQYPISQRKRLYLFLSSDAPLPQKWSCPPKIISRCCFEKYCFFFKKIVKWEILKTSTPTKKVILIFVARRPLPSKRSCPPTNGFFAVFYENTLFSKNLFNNKTFVTLIRDKEKLY